MRNLNNGFDELVNEPIVIPSNPYWDVFKSFGMDQTLAAIINAGGTFAIDYLLKNNCLTPLVGPISRQTSKAILSGAGPVVEKAGFFPAHFYEAYKEWRTTPKSKRDGISTYMKSAMKGGAKSLLEDILVHDPIYMGLMYGGLTIWPDTPAALVSVSAFGLAVLAVAIGEVSFNEIMYKNYKNSLKKAGFEEEDFFESRFYIDAKAPPKKFMTKMVDKFELGRPQTSRYQNLYFRNNIWTFNGRRPYLRLRSRLVEDRSTYWNSAQVVFIRTTELAKKHPEQYNYFPQRKQKFALTLPDEYMPRCFSEFENDKARRILMRGAIDKVGCEIDFQRVVARSPKLYVSTDRVVQSMIGEKYYVVELKAYPQNVGLLKQAMEYVMDEFPRVKQITHGKYEMHLAMNGNS